MSATPEVTALRETWRAPAAALRLPLRAPFDVRERDRVQLGKRVARGENERAAGQHGDGDRHEHGTQIARVEQRQHRAGMQVPKRAQQRRSRRNPQHTQAVEHDRHAAEPCG